MAPKIRVRDFLADFSLKYAARGDSGTCGGDAGRICRRTGAARGGGAEPGQKINDDSERARTQRFFAA